MGGGLRQHCAQHCPASVLLAVSECRARLALLPSCWLPFCLKYSPGFGGVAWVRVPSGSPSG